ncbi:MAG: PD-(D/E)XK nuclease family protein [Clostridiaceae bacterium]|nr:PD-(D/E)XK nuclease family protein [Clostridiaceae bacterium]
MLELVCSSNREDNISFLYSGVAKGISTGEKQLIIVPETHSHKAERRLLAECGNSAGIYASVMTFSRIALRALREAGRKPLSVDAGGRVLLMYRAVKAVESTLEYYKGAASRTDMLKGLIDVASEFRSCMVDPESLIENMKTMSPKLRDIAVIYSAYCAVCSGLSACGSDELELSLPYIAGYSGIRDADIFIYGFDGFTAAEYAVLDKVIEGSHGVTIALNIGKDTQLFSEQIKTKGRLERLADTHGLSWINKNPEHIERKQNECLEYIADKMFRFDETPYCGSSQAIQLYRCKDPLEECELIAGICRKLTLEEGVRLREIAVVSSEAEQYEKYLERSFMRYDLPIYISRKEDFLEKPAAAAALGAFRAIDDRMSFSSVLRYMKSGLVGLTRDEQELLENYAYTWQIKGNKWFSDWTMSPDGYDGKSDSDQLAAVNRIRKRLTEPLRELKEALPSSAKACQYAEIYKSHLERIELERLIMERAKSLEAEGRRQEASEYLQIYDILNEALTQFCAVMGEDILQRGDFFSLLQMMLSQYSIGTIPVSLDTVEFSDFERASFGSIKYLFILGAREGALPPVVTGSGLLKERDRIMLETYGIELTQSDDERTFEYMSDIYQLVDSAVKQIYFTYAEKTFGGSESTPSYLLGLVEKAFPESSFRSCEETLSENRLLAAVPAFETLCLRDGSPKWQAAYEYFKGREEIGLYEKLERYASSGRGPVALSKNIQALFGNAVYMSATRAEKISSCRFSYFMEYGLKAKERKQATFEATNVGTLVHYVVENAVRELSSDTSLDLGGVVEKYVKEFLEKRLGGSGDKTARFMANYSSIHENVQDIVKDIMEEIRSSDFKPIAFEMGFGGEEQFPPYKVESSDIALELHGQIDRVDGYIKDDILYLKVSDYKTGNKSFSISDIIAGINMQMFIYLLMLGGAPRGQLLALAREKLVGQPKDIASCAALYIPVKSPYVEALPSTDEDEIERARRNKVKRLGVVLSDREIIGALEHAENDEYRFLPVGILKNGEFSAWSKVLKEQELGLLLDKTNNNLREIARTISKGNIEANPYSFGGGRSYCDWCPFRQACQFDTDMEKDKYRYFKSYKNDEVIALIEKEKEEGEYGC